MKTAKLPAIATLLALSTSLVPSQLHAQESSAQPGDTEAVDGSAGLNEIIVTARRRQESLQEVPLAVTAYTQETLAEKAITDRTSLADNTPSLFTINGGYPREFAFFALRGQGPAFGSTPGVVNYFAEVPNSVNIDGRVGTYYDLASVQVLAGPQGTLFGKNATGGNILFEPMKPQDSNGAYVRAQYGNYNDRRIEGAVNAAPVPDRIMLRIAGEVGRRDGYTVDVGPFFPGKDYDNLSYESFRAALTVRPFDGLELYTVARYYDSHTNGGGTVLGAVNPTAGFDGTAFGLGFIPTAAIFPGITTALSEQNARGPRAVAYDLNQFSETHYWQVINQATLELGTDLRLRNIISFSKLRTLYGYDYDATAMPLAGQTSRVDPANPGLFTPGTIVPTLAPNVFTEELQLQGKAFGGALDFAIGGFLDRQKTELPAGIAQYTFFPFGSLVPSLSAIFDSNNRSEAVFGQGTLDLGRLSPGLVGLSFTGGLRYTWEHSFTSQIIGAPPAVAGSVDDSYLSYTATLDYDVTNTVHVYVTARDAFKSGGVNGPVPVGSQFRFFPAEKLSDIELGLKSQFAIGGAEGRLNVAAYRGIYDNIQRTTVESVATPAGPVLLNVTRSAAKGKIQGIEVNASLVPVTGLTLNTSYSYIDGKYTEVTDASAGAILNGAPFPYTPKHKVSLGATYEAQVGSAGELALGVNYVHQSSVSTAQTNGSFYNYLPGYGLLNATLDLKNIGGRPLDIGIFASNITDEAKPVGVADFYAGAPGVAGLTYNEPRMYGVRATFRFGD